MTPEGSKLRCADGVEDAKRGRVVCVVEDHSKEGVEASNYVAAVGAWMGRGDFRVYLLTTCVHV